LRLLIDSDRTSYHRTGNATSTTQSRLRSNEDVGHVLVLAEQRQMEDNLQRLRVRRHDDEFGDTTIQRLGRLVSAFLELLVVAGLLDQFENIFGQLRIGQRISLGIHFFRHLEIRLSFDVKTGFNLIWLME